MARGADGSMLTERQLKELNRKRFTDAVAEGNLYNTGPIGEDGSTGFGEDRWASYFKSNPEEAPSDWTGDSKSYIEKAPTDQEFLAQMDNMEVYDDEGELLYADGQEVGGGEGQDRNLNGDRDGDGSFKTYMRPVDIKDEVPTIIDEQIPTEEIRAGIDKRKAERPAKTAEIERRKAEVNNVDIDAEVAAEMAIEEEDSVETWTTSFESMSPETFNEINPEDVKDLSENAQTAYNQIKGMNTDLDQEVGEGMLSGKPMDEASKSDMMKSAMINIGLDDTQSAELLDKLKGICG